jgi:hypothetical protein
VIATSDLNHEFNSDELNSCYNEPTTTQTTTTTKKQKNSALSSTPKRKSENPKKNPLTTGTITKKLKIRKAQKHELKASYSTPIQTKHTAYKHKQYTITKPLLQTLTGYLEASKTKNLEICLRGE